MTFQTELIKIFFPKSVWSFKNNGLSYMLKPRVRILLKTVDSVATGLIKKTKVIKVNIYVKQNCNTLLCTWPFQVTVNLPIATAEMFIGFS